MELIVQWATILSPIIAVLIAWWMSRSSAKDTAKQIAALEESTTKQVESIKELASMMIEVNALQIDKELWDARHRQRQYSQEAFDDLDNQEKAYQLGIPVDKYSSIVNKQKEFERKSDFNMKQMDTLQSIQKRLEVMKKIIEGV